MAVRKRKKALLLDDFHLLSYQELDSTNEEAKRLAEGGAAHGAFIWALQQTDGKGRRGREWVSQDGNLFTSVLLSPDCELALLPQLSFVASVAVFDSVAPLVQLNHPVHCKWPNDLLVNHKKLAGILLESFETFESADLRKRWVVIGLGMNIEHFPQDVEFPATSLKEAGVELVSAKIILSRFVHHFIHWYSQWEEQGFEPIQKYWRENCLGIGQKICVRSHEDEKEGIFEDLDADGNLLLRCQQGELHKISSGDVFPL